MMLSPTDRMLLSALLSRQEETGTAGGITPERVAAIASGSRPDDREAATLLASPLAREELALHRRKRRFGSGGAAADQGANDNLLFPDRAAAASREEEGDADRTLYLFSGAWASLLVEPGPDSDTPYLLTLRLRPGMPGGMAGRTLEVREIDPDGLVWLVGRTDAAGVIQAAWTLAGFRPQDRPFASGLRVVDIDLGRG